MVCLLSNLEFFFHVFTSNLLSTINNIHNTFLRGLPRAFADRWHDLKMRQQFFSNIANTNSQQELTGKKATFFNSMTWKHDGDIFPNQTGDRLAKKQDTTGPPLEGVSFFFQELICFAQVTASLEQVQNHSISYSNPIEFIGNIFSLQLMHNKNCYDQFTDTCKLAARGHTLIAKAIRLILRK